MKQEAEALREKERKVKEHKEMINLEDQRQLKPEFKSLHQLKPSYLEL